MYRPPEDHPRLRGEKRVLIIHFLTPKGSPPLTRGKVTQTIINVGSDGITPAYAGKSGNHKVTSRKYRDHPRLRGEKYVPITSRIMRPGSPPLTRGKESRIAPTFPDCGITPAYAGKRLNTVAKRSHIICSCPVFYCISFNILPPPFNCSYSLLVISQSFSARCGFIFCQPKYLASVVSW